MLIVSQNQILHTDETWKAKKDESRKLVSSSEWDFRLGPPFLDLNENVDGNKSEPGWLETGFDDTKWSFAEKRSMTRKMSPALDPRRLTERPIPALPEIEEKFDAVATCQGKTTAEQWEGLLRKGIPVELAENTISVVDIESEVLTTGFLQLDCSGDGNAEIVITCAECYENDMDKGPRKKDNRTDYVNGKLYGPSDTYKTRKGANQYEPFWWRTFRYVRLHITCTSSPLTINSFTYRSTHYPLSITTTISTTSLELTNLWKISLNTLKNCMHETYEDCPFYEQNQFAMDSRSQMLFTYLLSSDDRLARKGIHEFYASSRDDGLVETHFPSPSREINIPQFSLYWTYMIRDHMVHFSDTSLVKTYIGTIDNILNYFEQRITSLGLVGRFDDDSWPFIDWAAEWMNFGKGFTAMCMPSCYLETGMATINSLVYAMALLSAADVCEFIGRKSTADEYRKRAADLNDAVNKHCYDSEQGIYLDGPSALSEKSQHAQIFAILAGTIKEEKAQDLMRKTIGKWKELGMVKASFAMSFYLFRAAAKVDVYEECWDTMIQPWRKMISQGLTTWAESDSMQRSDCHGWSATPMYEIVREILGVTPAPGPVGYGRGLVRVKPRVELVKEMKGLCIVGGGRTVEVSWDESKLISITCSEDMDIEISLEGILQVVKMEGGKPFSVTT